MDEDTYTDVKMEHMENLWRVLNQHMIGRQKLDSLENQIHFGFLIASHCWLVVCGPHIIAVIKFLSCNSMSWPLQTIKGLVLHDLLWSPRVYSMLSMTFNTGGLHTDKTRMESEDTGISGYLSITGRVKTGISWEDEHLPGVISPSYLILQGEWKTSAIPTRALQSTTQYAAKDIRGRQILYIIVWLHDEIPICETSSKQYELLVKLY